MNVGAAFRASYRYGFDCAAPAKRRLLSSAPCRGHCRRDSMALRLDHIDAQSRIVIATVCVALAMRCRHPQGTRAGLEMTCDWSACLSPRRVADRSGGRPVQIYGSQSTQMKAHVKLLRTSTNHKFRSPRARIP